MDPAETPEADTSDMHWVEGLSDENAAFANGKGWEGPDSVIDSYRNLESLFGHDRAVPGVVHVGQPRAADRIKAIQGQ